MRARYLFESAIQPPMHQHDIGYCDSRSGDSWLTSASVCTEFDMAHGSVMLLQNGKGKQIWLKLNTFLSPNPSLERMLHFGHLCHKIRSLD